MRPPGQGQLDGHPGEHLIPQLAAKGLRGKAIAAELSKIGPPVTARAIEWRLITLSSAIRKIADSTASPSNPRAIPALKPHEAATLPAVESFVSAVSELEAKTNRMLERAAEGDDYSGASSLIRSSLACIRQRAEFVGALNPAATNVVQAVIVLGDAFSALPEPIEVRDPQFLDSDE